MEGENTLADRTASFSVYLNTAQDSLLKKLTTDHVQLPSATLIPSDECPVVPVRPGKVVPKDSEIGVFGAEKYFNMKIDDRDDESFGATPRPVDDYTRKAGYKKEDRANPQHGVSKMRLGTPSISSESSWGSQTAFLRSFQRSLSHSRKSSNRRGCFARLRCNKSCADRKSIHVSERLSQQGEATAQNNVCAPEGGSGRKLASHSHSVVQSQDEVHSFGLEKPRSESKRMEAFAFPVLDNNAQIKAPKAVDEPRTSIEVFGSNGKKRTDDVVAKNLERKLSMLSWDAIPKAKVLKNPTKMDDDFGSEASSELFEIENISGAGTIPPSTCYAPSEASIEWSVVTASAADFSVASEYDENKEILADIRRVNGMLPPPRNRPNVTRNLNERESPKNRPGGLLGCKSHKAVELAEVVHKTGEKPRTPRTHLSLDAAAVP